MVELKKLVTELKAYYRKKELEVGQRDQSNSYTAGLLLNRQIDIKNFELASTKVDNDPNLKQTIITNFKLEYKKIKELIDKI